jgi:hypothetical protein
MLQPEACRGRVHRLEIHRAALIPLRSAPAQRAIEEHCGDASPTQRLCGVRGRYAHGLLVANDGARLCARGTRRKERHWLSVSESQPQGVCGILHPLFEVSLVVLVNVLQKGRSCSNVPVQCFVQLCHVPQIPGIATPNSHTGIPTLDRVHTTQSVRSDHAEPKPMEGFDRLTFLGQQADEVSEAAVVHPLGREMRVHVFIRSPCNVPARPVRPFGAEHCPPATELRYDEPNQETHHVTPGKGHNARRAPLEFTQHHPHGSHIPVAHGQQRNPFTQRAVTINHQCSGLFDMRCSHRYHCQLHRAGSISPAELVTSLRVLPGCTIGAGNPGALACVESPPNLTTSGPRRELRCAP